VQFHVLSFEGPDGYSRAGGIASRVCGLTESLAHLGFETHLWFIGDPDLAGGVYFDAALDRFRKWRLSPVPSLGGYEQGDSKRLGGVLEFHLGGSLTYLLDSGSRLGLSVTHISNTFIHKENPGAEIITLSYMIPFDGMKSAQRQILLSLAGPIDGQ
jgi:hypothetical protein